MLEVRDLETGTAQRVAAGMATGFDGIEVDPAIPMRWSLSGSTLAVTSPGGAVTLLAVASGEVTGLDEVRGVVAGWRGDDRLVVVGPPGGENPVGLGGGPPRVDDRARHDHAERERGVHPVAAPRRSHAGVGDFTPIVVDLESGDQRTVSCDCLPATQAVWVSSDALLVQVGTTAASLSVLGPTVYVALDIKTGAVVTTTVALSPRLETATWVSVANDALAAGPAGAPHTSLWWPGWYVDSIAYGLAALALLLVTVVLRRRIAARKRLAAAQAPGR